MGDREWAGGSARGPAGAEKAPVGLGCWKPRQKLWIGLAAGQLSPHRVPSESVVGTQEHVHILGSKGFVYSAGGCCLACFFGGGGWWMRKGIGHHGVTSGNMADNIVCQLIVDKPQTHGIGLFTRRLQRTGPDRVEPEPNKPKKAQKPLSFQKVNFLTQILKVAPFRDIFFCPGWPMFALLKAKRNKPWSDDIFWVRTLCPTTPGRRTDILVAGQGAGG